MKEKKRIGMIGVGNIAQFHIKALNAVGLEVVACAGTQNSERAMAFAAQHGVPRVCSCSHDMLSIADELDGFVIATSPEATLQILEESLETKKPILVEKPVSLKASELSIFEHASPSNVLVAYNRRFYNSVQKAREFVRGTSGKLRAIMQLPERVPNNEGDPFYDVHENSVHGIDMLRFVFGEITPDYNQSFNTVDSEFGRIAIFRSQDGHDIVLHMNWIAPANFSLSIDDGVKRVELSPFEKFACFEGMDIQQPSVEYPLRIYTPKLKEQTDVFVNSPLDIKPGFLGQAREFSELLSGTNRRLGASLKDAYIAQKIVCDIIG